MCGDSKVAFLHCGDVVGPCWADLSCCEGTQSELSPSGQSPACSPQHHTQLKKVKASAALTERTPYCYQTSMSRLDTRPQCHVWIPDLNVTSGYHFTRFDQYLTAWGVEPVVTHQTSLLDSTGVCGVQQNQAGGSSVQ